MSRNLDVSGIEPTSPESQCMAVTSTLTTRPHRPPLRVVCLVPSKLVALLGTRLEHLSKPKNANNTKHLTMTPTLPNLSHNLKIATSCGTDKTCLALTVVGKDSEIARNISCTLYEEKASAFTLLQRQKRLIPLT